MTRLPEPLTAPWSLDPGIAHLNHGSFGAAPTEVLEAQREWQARLEREPVRFLARDLWTELQRVREAVGAFVGAPADDIALVPNATSGVNSVLRSMTFEAGDELVVTNHGYNACSNTVHFVAERSGAVVRVAEFPFPIRSADEVVQGIERALTERTKLLLVDHVTSPTGLVLPVERIVQLARSRGIQVMIDGAHAPGMLPLALADLGADYYTGNFHKWVCTPKGSAFLHVRPDRQSSIAPWIISHGRNAPTTEYSRFRLEFEWTGTVDPSPWLVMPAAIEYVASLVEGGWDEVRRRNRALALYGRDRLCEALRLDRPAPDDMLGSLAAVPLPDGAATQSPGAFEVDPLQKAIYDDLALEVPVHTWPTAPKRLIRLSAQLYNDPADYERLAAWLARRLASPR